MNLALSNFAWDNNESKVIFKTLKNNDISNIECVLTKIKTWDDLTVDDIKNYKKELRRQKITPYSIQSLFYNVDTDNLCNIEKNILHIKKLIEFFKDIMMTDMELYKIFYDKYGKFIKFGVRDEEDDNNVTKLKELLIFKSLKSLI